jgi:hypothetical protein
MPRPHTFPTLYNECKTISITFLKEHGYLKPDQWLSGTVTWSRNGQKTGSISIAVFTYGENSFLELDYKCSDKPIRYKVPLITKPSNIGKGKVCFFKCPHTGKLCRKLYREDTYFFHRQTFKGCMYEKQTYSKKNREHFRLLDKLFCADQVNEQLHSKYFKTYYAGQATKRYRKLWKQLREADKLSERDFYSF